MSQLPLTLFDAVVIVVVLLSAFLAFARGAVAEVLALASWLGAAIVAFALAPLVTPMVKTAVANDIVANVLAVGGVFLVALVVFKLVTGMISRAVADSALSPIDKLLGLVFGVARGVVLVCAAYLVATYLIKPELQPEWVRQAYLLQPVRNGAQVLERMVPQSYRDEGLAAAGQALDAAAATAGGAAAGGAAGTSGQGYTPDQRKAVDRLLQPPPSPPPLQQQPR